MMEDSLKDNTDTDGRISVIGGEILKETQTEQEMC